MVAFKGADPTLEQVINYELLKPEVKGLLDCLYDPEEKQQNLSEGFRARPNIGAAAMLATTANENDPFWSQIYKAIESARGGEEVRVFILSSIFGGTGASGFPNIARRIRTIQKEKMLHQTFILGELCYFLILLTMFQTRIWKGKYLQTRTIFRSNKRCFRVLF